MKIIPGVSLQVFSIATKNTKSAKVAANAKKSPNRIFYFSTFTFEASLSMTVITQPDNAMKLPMISNLTTGFLRNILMITIIAPDKLDNTVACAIIVFSEENNLRACNKAPAGVIINILFIMSHSSNFLRS